MKKIIACILSIVLVFSCTGGALAASGSSDTLTSIYEKVVGTVLDVLIGALALSNRPWELPTYEEYLAENDEFFYEGTDGTVSGNSWSLGYASASVIPAAWRTDANGNADPNGYCFDQEYYFGGYFTAKGSKIYDDQRVNLVVMSVGSDSNGNGKDDIIIFASLDAVGFANKDVRDIRSTCLNSLSDYGITNDDIIGFNISSTHAHTVLDAEGLSLDLIWPLLKHKFLFSKARSAQEELLSTIKTQTASAVVAAYTKMEAGTLSYFETAKVDGSETYSMLYDKRDYGADFQDHFACLLFEGGSGENTILSNVGLHPTKAGRSSGRLCADIPSYINSALSEAGYNSVFIQGAQGSVGLSLDYSDSAYARAEQAALTYDEWAARYGNEYADANFNDGEADYKEIRATAYTVSDLILDGIAGKTVITPKINATVEEIALPLDYTILYFGGVTQLVGFNCVRKFEGSETNCALMVESGYIELGDDLAILTLPGEVSPTLIYGTQEGYAGEKLWQGPTSWTGNDWEYAAIEDHIRTATGDTDKTVICFGLCNDAVGYFIPDTDAAHFSVDWAYGGHYDELLSCGNHVASALTAGLIDVVNKNAAK